MPILWVRFKDQPIGEYKLAQGASLTIGRKPGNDVVIDNLAVSGSHAKIDCLEEGYLLTDLKSKNGTFVNGKLVASHWLKKEDIITIGKHTLILTLAEGEDLPQAPPDGAQPEKTMFLDTDQYRLMLDKSTPDLTAAPGRKEPIGVLSFLRGGKGDVVLKKKLTKIGKDTSSDLVVNGLLVGRTAATISKRPAGFYLSYVEGFAKPRVNGKAVKGTIQLKDFDVIELGSAKMEFITKE